MTDNNSNTACLVCVAVLGSIILLSIHPLLFVLALVILILVLYAANQKNKNSNQRASKPPVNIKNANKTQTAYKKTNFNPTYDRKEETALNEIRRLIQSEDYRYLEEFVAEHLNESYTYEDVASLKQKLSGKGFNIEHDDLIRIINEEIKYQKYGTY